MSDFRVKLAIQFAERLSDMGTPTLRACELAAAAHRLTTEDVLIAWLRKLLRT